MSTIARVSPIEGVPLKREVTVLYNSRPTHDIPSLFYYRYSKKFVEITVYDFFLYGGIIGVIKEGVLSKYLQRP